MVSRTQLTRGLLAALLPVAASLYGVLPPLGGTWSCQDPSIRFNYKGDTVSTKLLLCSILIPIFFVVLITETFHVPWSRLWVVTRTAFSTTLSVYLRFFVSLTFNIVVNMVLKTLSSVPRPHFVDTCSPDWNRINCSANGGHVDFQLEDCVGEEGGRERVREVYDAFKSFPSGHAQLSCFTAAFLMVYLERRLGTSHSRLWKYWLHLLITCLASFSCFSRLQDHRHHLLDVLVGAVLGLGMGVIAALGLELPDQEFGGVEKEGIKKDMQEQFVKQKRPSKMRLLNSEFGSVVETERELREVNPNPAC